MAKNIISASAPRGQVAIICEALQNKDGYTAQELRAEAGGVTPHNSWSLTRIADRFGYRLSTVDGSEYEDGLKRYFFTKAVAKKPTTAKKPAKKTATKAAAASVRRAPRKIAATKAPASRKAAKAAAKAAMRKASR